MDPNVLTVEDLEPLDVLKPAECNYPGLKASETTKNGSQDQGLKELEASEDTKVEEGGMQRSGDQEEWVFYLKFHYLAILLLLSLTLLCYHFSELVFKVNTDEATKKRNIFHKGMPPPKRT